MKKTKIAIIAAAVMLLPSSCRKAEDRAASLAEEKIEETLYYPGSYELTSITLDSAKAPYETPEFHDLAYKYARTSWNLEDARRRKRQAEEEIALYDARFSPYEKVKKNEAREDYGIAANDEKGATDSIGALRKELEELSSQKPSRAGMKAVISYRAKSNSGEVSIGHAEVLFDKDITKVIAFYDMDSGEYNIYTAAREELEKK